MNEDKKNWLNKLAAINAMAEELDEYLRELAEAASELGGQERGARPAGTVTVTVRTFDQVRCEPCVTRRSAALNAAEVGREQEAAREIQQDLASSRRAALAEGEALEQREDAVIEMLAEALRELGPPPARARSSP